MPIVDTTRLAAVSPAATLRFDAVGCASSLDHTVTCVAAEAFVAVTFNTTAVAPGGMPLVSTST